MTVARFAVSFDPALARAVRRSAGKEATSTWLADAARRKLRGEGLLREVSAWEAEHGTISAAEIEEARRAQQKPKKRK